MNRNELAKELGVWEWDVDDWLLWGCPVKKLGKRWEFNPEKVTRWIQTEKIKTKRINRPHSTKLTFDHRWLTGRCPICTDRGFPGAKAGRVYTLGEVSEGEWHLRRTGIPCGHSAYVPIKKEDSKSYFLETVTRGLEVTANRKRILESLAATSKVRQEKIARLKRAIRQGTYEIRAGDIATKLLKHLLLGRALRPKGEEYTSWGVELIS